MSIEHERDSKLMSLQMEGDGQATVVLHVGGLRFAT